MTTLYNEVLEEINNGIINGLKENPVFYAVFDFESYLEDATLTKSEIDNIIKLYRNRGFTSTAIKNKIHINWNSPQTTYLTYKAYDYNYNEFDWTTLLNTTYTAQELYVRLLDGKDFKQLAPYNLKQQILSSISYRKHKTLKQYKDARFYGIKPETVINLYANIFNELAEKNIYVTVDSDGVMLIEWNVIKDEFSNYIQNFINI